MSSPLYLDAAQLARLLPFSSLRRELGAALRELSRGAAKHSARHVLPVAGGALGMMGGASGGALGAKVVGVFPGNRARGLNPHQGLVLLLNPATGEPLALGCGATITATRTAAVSALATDLLARGDASVLVVVGTGLQAELHVAAIREVRGIREVRVVGRTPEAARAFAAKVGGGVAFSSLEEALDGADILCLCTSASTPYLRSRALPPGLHVNAIGACRPGAREVEIEECGNFSFFVESRSAAKEEAEELKPVPAAKITELGSVLLGEAPGRVAESQITFYKGVGIGLEDVCALGLAYQNYQDEQSSQEGSSHEPLHPPPPHSPPPPSRGAPAR